MMNRRGFVRLSCASVAMVSIGAHAQSAGRMRKVGVLNALPREAPLPQALLRGLRDLGYIEGKNIVIEYRSGPTGDFPALAEDLVKQKVDVIYAVLDNAALAASHATTTIPVVFAVLGDPVRSGLVASLARPGGNVTGLTAFGADLGDKRIELLKEMVPRLSVVGVLWNPARVSRAPAGSQGKGTVGLEQLEVASRGLGVKVQTYPVRSQGEIGTALEAATRDRIGALVVEEDSLTFSERDRIIEYAAAHELPAIYGYREYVASGGLMSYGAKLPELMQRALDYIDRILKGAKPGDLPIEQPAKFELVINAKTAKALGLTIPQSLLFRADEVMQ